MYNISSVNHVKSHNISQVVSAISSLKFATKNTIAEITGLSIATCNTILNELSEKKIILLYDSETPTAGRPAKVYKFNEHYSHILCIYPTYERGIKRINYSITDLFGNIIDQSFFIFEYVNYSIIEKVISTIIKNDNKIKTISFGIPGYYNNSKIQSCGIEELNGCDIVKELINSFHCDVCVENDMNATAYGIYKQSDDFSQDISDLVLISFFKNRGTGSAIILDGEIITGSTNFAGETNYLPFAMNEVKSIVNGTHEQLIDFAIKSVSVFSTIINPSRIFFTGENLSSEMLNEIRDGALKYIPAEHLPDLFYGNNFFRYYILGLAAIALDNINFSNM